MKQEIVIGKKSDKPFSAGIETESLVFVSGQGGIDPATGAIVGDDIETQTVQTMENIRAVLASANLDLDDIVKVTVYLSDRAHYDAFNSVYQTYFRSPYPSRTAVYCDLNFDLLVEIDAIAVAKK